MKKMVVVMMMMMMMMMMMIEESNHVPLCFARERGVGERRCTHQDGGRGGTKSREMSDDRLE